MRRVIDSVAAGTNEAAFGPDPVSSNGIGLALTTKVFVSCGSRCYPPPPEQEEALP